MKAFKKAVDLLCTDANHELKLECYDLALKKHLEMTRKMVEGVIVNATKSAEEEVPHELPSNLAEQMLNDAIDKFINAKRNLNLRNLRSNITAIRSAMNRAIKCYAMHNQYNRVLAKRYYPFEETEFDLHNGKFDIVDTFPEEDIVSMPDILENEAVTAAAKRKRLDAQKKFPSHKELMKILRPKPKVPVIDLLERRLMYRRDSESTTDSSGSGSSGGTDLSRLSEDERRGRQKDPSYHPGQ